MRIALAVFLALAVAAPAQAATDITWPAARGYKPGEQVTVRVKAKRTVQVAVLRVTSSGKVMGSVVRRSVKSGSVRATLPRAGTYAVRVNETQRTLKVVAPVVPSPTPAATETAPAATEPVAPCLGRPISRTVEVRLGADRVQRGQLLPYSVVNTSAGTCMFLGAGYALEHQQADGTWEPALTEITFVAVGYVVSAEQWAKAVFIPSYAPLGRYRLIEMGGSTEPTFEVIV